MKRIIALGIVVLALAGCGEQGGNAADVTERNQRDLQRVQIVNSPYGWSNTLVGCDGPNLLYISQNGSGMFIVPNDPYCQGVTR